MSFVTPTDSLGLAGSGSTGLPPISAADLPASVRSGPPAAKQAYTEALEFEQVLVNQLAQQLTATATQSSTDSSGDSTDGSDDSSSDSSSDGLGDASTGMLGSDPSSSLLSTLIPQALTDSIMSSGGLGIASELAQSIDPSLKLSK